MHCCITTFKLQDGFKGKKKKAQLPLKAVQGFKGVYQPLISRYDNMTPYCRRNRLVAQIPPSVWHVVCPWWFIEWRIISTGCHHCASSQHVRLEIVLLLHVRDGVQKTELGIQQN